MKGGRNMLGPIDYIAVGFVGNNFNGGILTELQKAVDSGIIRVIDIVFVIKDEAGNVQIAEIEDQHEDLKAVTEALGFKPDTPLLTEDNVETLSESMANNTSAGILIFEHIWAKGLKKALVEADGFLLAEGRIHPDKALAALEDLAQMSLTK
jgi:hypothetical protein